MRAAAIACLCASTLLIAGWPACLATAEEAILPAASVAATGTLPVQLPLRRETQDSSGTGLGWRAAGLLLLAGGAGGWLLWRRGMAARGAARTPREAHAVLRLSSQALTPQASVHAVRWQGEDLLLGCTAQQVTLLGRRPTEPVDGERT